jgi:hypothetical protein
VLVLHSVQHLLQDCPCMLLRRWCLRRLRLALVAMLLLRLCFRLAGLVLHRHKLPRKLLCLHLQLAKRHPSNACCQSCSRLAPRYCTALLPPPLHPPPHRPSQHVAHDARRASPPRPQQSHAVAPLLAASTAPRAAPPPRAVGGNNLVSIPPTVEGWVYRVSYTWPSMGCTEAIWATHTYIH